jgi:tetratricopeptide (TPR) repeat protein
MKGNRIHMSTNRIRVRTARLLAATALVVPATLLSQDARTVADSLVHAADVAAYQSKPYEAIAAYERAIALDRYLRLPLLPRLGRQYLWSDRPKQAAQLFSEYLELHPRACETQLDLGLALSWANELDAARVAYDSVAAQCVYERGAARLGAARVLRWGNHFAESERRYRAIQADGSDLDREQAAIGLAYVRLAQGRPRAALALADSMIATGSNDRSLVEARAMALADLGALGAAVDLVHGEREAGRGSASMDRLAQGWEERARTSFALGTRGFRDHDGTSYRAAELASGAAPLALGKVRVTGRAAQLRGDGVELRSREVETALDLRPARAVALSARAGLSAYDDIAFSPWDGEINVAWLPSDRHRLDVAAAHVVINDNVAAIQNHLTGTFGSVGISERLTPGLSLAVSADATRWSEDNTRLRFRVTPRWSFEGVPIFTVEWPTTYQHYDAPFDFRFFSPEEYVETGPAVNVSKRVARVWYLSAYARGGALRETGSEWQPLGMGRASVERDVSSHWGVRLDGGWSNSNLTGSAGFQRTSLSLGVTIRP